MDQESFELSCLLDEDAAKASGKDAFVAQRQDANHVKQVKHLQVLMQLFVHVFGGII